MNRPKKRVKKPAKLILKEVDFEDTIKRRVHKGGYYGKIYLPKEWINKEVYVGLVKNGE